MQTPEGAKKAVAKLKAKDPDYFKKIGKIGGANGNTGGFASLSKDKNGLTGRERAMKYGAIGGTISKRGKDTKPRHDKTTQDKGNFNWIFKK